MALGAEQDQCREGTTTGCFSFDLGLPNTMSNAGVHVVEVLSPALARYHSDSLESKEKPIFPMPFYKTTYFEEGDKLLPSHAVSNIYGIAVTCLPLSDVLSSKETSSPPFFQH